MEYVLVEKERILKYLLQYLTMDIYIGLKKIIKMVEIKIHSRFMLAIFLSYLLIVFPTCSDFLFRL